MASSVLENNTMASKSGKLVHNGTVIKDFVLVENPADLESVLTSRLPVSANVLNAVKMCQKWGNEMQCFTYGWEENPEDAWIAVKNFRKDHGQEIEISRPQGKPIPSYMREVLKHAKFINWDEGYVFCAVDTEISSLLCDISIRDYGNCTAVHPCYLFYLDIEEGRKLNPALKDNDPAQIISLSPGQGTEFIVKTWKYATPDSPAFIDKCLQLNPSGGVSVDGKIVSGVGVVTHGLIGMLYTLAEARGKGYARVTMHSVMKSLADEGFIPACTVETRNLNSKALQHKIGFKEGPIVDFVVYEKTGFD